MPTPTIDAGVSGGNILIDQITESDIHLRPDLRDTVGPWFYWAFKIQHAAGKTIAFHFTRNEPLTARGPACSLNGGRTWSWLGLANGSNNSFSYSFPADAGDVLFALAPIYTADNLNAFLAEFPIRQETLCVSRQKRAVPILFLGNGAAPRFRVLVTARHHACETMGSFALEGFLRELLGGSGRWLRENAEFLIVPFVDLDGVEQGDQGKNRAPYDHNRDYGGTSLYPETATLRELVPGWAGGVPLVALDLHCPWIRGPRHEVVYQVGSDQAGVWSEQQRFGRLLEGQEGGALPYRATDDLAFGLDWNTAASFGAGVSFAQWVQTLSGTGLVTTLELPYANASGAEVNPGSARSFGGARARGLEAYLAGGG